MNFCNIFHVIWGCAFDSLQSSVEQYHQLQKECEDLKDAKSAAEACLATFKTRVQQLEKGAQSNDQLLSKLENQVLFLSEDKPLQ
jgi:predicted  nucleic acid-binding Zn-ribbon protein